MSPCNGARAEGTAPSTQNDLWGLERVLPDGVGMETRVFFFFCFFFWQSGNHVRLSTFFLPH